MLKKIKNFIKKIMPLKIWIRYTYRKRCKRKLNLKKPRRYTEKLQHFKLYYKNDLLEIVTDKYKVNDYIQSKGLSKILNKRYGVYNNFKEINFDELPDQFIIKFNKFSGYNKIIDDKNQINLQSLEKIINGWFKVDYSDFIDEPWYKDIKPKIIIEKLLKRNHKGDIPDYKFFCFDGKIEYVYVMTDYVDDHSLGRLNFFDKEFNKLPFRRKDFPPIIDKLKKPLNYELMLEYAKILSKDFPQVRVDFYNIEGDIIFGELTFATAKGYINFEPDEFDFILGNKFKINY